MKHRLSLILFSALLSSTFAWSEERAYGDWTDFSPLGLSKGDYYVTSNKNVWHKNLNIQVRECTSDPQYKQIKVHDWNYSDSDKAQLDLIIDWNSETNVCTISKQSARYTIDKDTIYISTRSHGTYNPETATFTFPIQYVAGENVLSTVDAIDMLRMQKAVTSITFKEEEYTLASGYAKIIIPTVFPADATNKSVTYTSSNPDVATVDNGEDNEHPAGKIHFQSVGTTTITATANDGSGVSGSYKLITFICVTGITLDKTSVDLCPECDVTLTATVEPLDATTKTVTWSSDNEKVVTVDENGKLQFVGIGSAKVKASANDDSNKSCSCSVSTYRISPAHPEYGTEYIVPVDGGTAYFKDAPSKSQLQFVLEGKGYVKDDWIVSGNNIAKWVRFVRDYSVESHKVSVSFEFNVKESTPTPREGRLSVTAYDYKFDYTISQAAPTSTYTRDVKPDNWGTICLPWTSIALEGATFYNVLGTKDETQGIALEEINQLDAGKPYVFKATSNKIIVTYDSKETQKQEPINAGNHIIGSFTECPVTPGMYIIYENLLYKAGTDVSISANCAYFDADAMTPFVQSQAPARVVFFGGSQSPTGLEVQEARCTMHDGKFLINGQFVIIKDNRMYNAQGQLTTKQL